MKKVYTKLLAIFSICFSSAVLSQAELVGEIKGQFAVSPQGAASYSIPIELPSGAGGIKPELALSYNSNGGNGVMGVGWSIQGLSEITRCNATKDEDGFRSSLKFEDKTLRFCLDGQKLVAADGEYGASGTSYRTVSDSFLAVEGVGAANTDNKSYFRARSKDGNTLVYGRGEINGDRTFGDQYAGVARPITSYDYRAYGPQGRVHAWHLESISDVSGNSINYFYRGAYAEESPSIFNGLLKNLVSRIEYPGPSDNPFSVVFNYTPRHESLRSPSALPQELLHSEQYLEEQLDSIQIMVGSKELTAYYFEYEASPVTDRLRLKKVRQCNQEGCLFPTTFSWNKPSEGQQFEKSLSYSVPKVIFDKSEKKSELLDLNGDGLPDFIAGTDVYINSGENWIKQAGWQLPGAVKDDKLTRGYWSDFNNDGLIDYLYLNTSSAAQSSPELLLTQLFGGGSLFGSSIVGQDSGADTAALVFLNNGSGWTPAGDIDISLKLKDKKFSKYPVLFDVNHDGFVDVVFGNKGNNVTYLNPGCTFVSCELIQSDRKLPYHLVNSSGSPLLLPY